MHPDFKRLATLRRFMMQGDPRQSADFGRSAAATWVARHAPALPDTVTVSDLPDQAGLRLVPYNPAPRRGVIYLHGGGLVFYTPQVFAPFLGQLADQTGLTVLALDYDKAPGTPGPAILHQLEHRLRDQLARHPDWDFTLMGDSVGGLLAVQLAARMQSPQITALQLIYPVTDLQVAANDPHGQGHFLDSDMMEWFYGFIRPLCAGQPVPCQMWSTQLRALPPVGLHVAGADILAPQARRFGAALHRAGRLMQLEDHEDLPHDFCLYSGSSDAAARAVTSIARSLDRALTDA
jgi:acetyl esterase/lipase